jgi:hypothetical protein
MIQSASIASEATFANPDSAGIPTTTGLTFYDFVFDRGSVSTVGGATPVDESASATNAFFGAPPEAGVAWVNGSRVNMQTGALAFNMELRGFGTGNGAVPDANLMPLTQMFGTITDVLDTGAATQAIATGAADGQSVTVTTGTTLAPGEVVLSSIDGCVLANRVTAVTVGATDTVTFELAWPRQLTASDTLKRGMNFRILQSLGTGTVGNTVAVRFRCAHATMIAYGCRADSLTFSATTNGKVMVAVSLRSDYIVSTTLDAQQAVGYAARFGSPVCQLRGSGGLVSTETLAGVAAPVSLESRRPAFEIDAWSVALTATLAPIGSGCGAVGLSGLEVAAMTVTVSYTSRTIYEADQTDRLLGATRALSWAAGPIVDGTASSLNGWGISIPSAFLSADPSVAVGGEVLSQTRTYSAAYYAGDSPLSAIGPAMFLGGA